MSEAWRTLKSLRTSSKEKIPNNIIPPSVWTDYYKNLLTEDRSKFMIENWWEWWPRPIIYRRRPLITKEEVRKGLNIMKNDRAAGPKDLLKYGPDLLFRLLTFDFYCFLRGEQLPPK